MHIVFVSREYHDSKRGGGIATYLHDLITLVLEEGHQVTLITASDDTRQYTVAVNGKFTKVNLEGGDFIIPEVEPGMIQMKKFRIFFRFFSYRMKVLREVLKLKNVDVLEVAEFGAESVFFRKFDFPVVYRLHTSSLLDRSNGGVFKFRLGMIPNFFTGYFEKRMLRFADYITSCSNSLKDWTSTYFNIPQNQIEVLYNPINLKNWKFTRSEESLAALKILYVGTVSYEKGVGELVEACKLLKGKGVDLTLTIAGKLGTFGKNLQQDLKDDTWCSFIGHITKQELVHVYETHSVAVFPSHWEAMGLVTLEAMYSGALVIGSSEGGMSELIEDGKNGFLATPKDAEGLAERIEHVLGLSHEEKITISTNAIQHVIENFSDKKIVPQFLEYYKKVIADYKVKSAKK
ncbi:glycosyltransferase involved in cell wall biosynthesis [Algoriphagus sp. 4150]|uniref:glycosyltransferase family 4 protein n=1 Tax=Algoriphagus sp. 4150 TaxID=2817756 RepID=UPI00285A5A62|nr:glycosyltransferase family 4 protein [Algoriphagus sp. 4150]MDR7130548.1 glycosyltransferase involved in cell wall biosynthesis [Algoriphagus sp. 4150]